MKAYQVVGADGSPATSERWDGGADDLAIFESAEDCQGWIKYLKEECAVDDDLFIREIKIIVIKQFVV